MAPETASDSPPASDSGSPFPAIRTVPVSAAFDWLVHGWSDLRHAPVASMTYGAIFALMGWLIALVFRHAYEYTSALTAGFLLVGPFLATGLYDISRRLQRGRGRALPTR